MAYLQLGDGTFKTTVDEDTVEVIDWLGTAADGAPASRRAKLPRVIFVR